jgi:glycosyltransferase involved in cell wall biosynthesis
MHVLWMNESATFAGGCEQYIHRTVQLLRDRGIRSSLLYEPSGGADPAYLRAFAGAYPRVDLGGQLADLDADLVYVHRTGRGVPWRALAASGLPRVRFFHDHQLFCLRGSKYTTLGRRTCTRTLGPACYPCLGFVNRSTSWPGVRLTRVGRLRAEQAEQFDFEGFVTGSAYMAEHVAAHGFDRTRCHVLPLFCPPPAPSPPVTREPDLLLFVGALLRGKGLDILFQALTRMRRSARLVVVGGGRQEALHRSWCSRLGLTGRVKFAGPVSGADLGSYYERAACLVFPSRSPETFGLVGVEAMSHATPVIASAVGGVHEWLVEGETGLTFASGDAQALAAAVDRLLDDPPFARQLGEEGRRVYERRFRPERHVDALVKLFTSLIRPKPLA